MREHWGSRRRRRCVCRSDSAAGAGADGSGGAAVFRHACGCDRGHLVCVLQTRVAVATVADILGLLPWAGRLDDEYVWPSVAAAVIANL